jgi:hypothetical protein
MVSSMVKLSLNGVSGRQKPFALRVNRLDAARSALYVFLYLNVTTSLRLGQLIRREH